MKRYLMYSKDKNKVVFAIPDETGLEILKGIRRDDSDFENSRIKTIFMPYNKAVVTGKIITKPDYFKNKS